MNLVKTGTRETLKSKQYRQYLSGAIFGGIGAWMVRTTQIVLAIEVSHGNGAFVGITTAAQYIPILIFSASVGALADRRSKAAILILGQVIMVTSALGQVVALPYSHEAPWLVVAGSFVFGLGAALDGPMRTAVVPTLVPQEHIAGAVSMNVVIIQIGRVIGPVIAGGLVAWSGFGITFTVAALLVAGFIIALPRLIKQSSPPADAVRGSIRDGISYVFHHRQILTVFILIGVGGLVGPNLLTISALVINRIYEGGAVEIGYSSTVLAIGALAGAVWAARLKQMTLRILAIVTVLVGVITTICAFAPNLPLYLALLCVAGAFALAMVSMGTALVQSMVTGPMRGRISGLYFIILIAGAPIGAPILGVMTDAWGAQEAQIISGISVAVLAGAVALFARPSRRNKETLTP